MNPRLVQAANSSPMTLDGTRSYIVGRRRTVVIDPGPDDPAHVEALVEALSAAESIDIVATHHHADHAGAARALSERVGGRVWIGGVAGSEVSGNARSAADGQGFDTDEGALTVLRTPGHTPDHIALLWEKPSGRRVVFVGDLVLGAGDTTLVAAPEGDVADYLRSLDRIEALRAETLYSTHGNPLTDPPAAIRRYRNHRLERVEQVEAVLRDDPGATTAEIVSRIYGEALPSRIHEAAFGSVEAARIYLQSHRD